MDNFPVFFFAGTGGVSDHLPRPLRLLCANRGRISPLSTLSTLEREPSTADCIPRHMSWRFWDSIQSSDYRTWERHHNRVGTHVLYTYQGSNLGIYPTFATYIHRQWTARGGNSLSGRTALSASRISVKITISLQGPLPPSVVRWCVTAIDTNSAGQMVSPQPLVLSLFGILGLSTDHL